MKFRYSEKATKFDPSATYNLILLNIGMSKKKWKMGHPDFSRIESYLPTQIFRPCAIP